MAELLQAKPPVVNPGSNPTVHGLYDDDPRAQGVPYDIQAEIQTALANAETALLYKNWDVLEHSLQALLEIGANHKVDPANALWTWIKETQVKLTAGREEKPVTPDPEINTDLPGFDAEAPVT